MDDGSVLLMKSARCQGRVEIWMQIISRFSTAMTTRAIAAACNSYNIMAALGLPALEIVYWLWKVKITAEIPWSRAVESGKWEVTDGARATVFYLLLQRHMPFCLPNKPITLSFNE
jgi:hypothetical protein